MSIDLQSAITECLRDIELLSTALEQRGAEVPELTSVTAPEWNEGWTRRDDGHSYEPSEGQLEFHNSKARFKALVGGRGSGKSAAGAQEALKRIRKGLSGAVFNPDFENFKLSTWPAFKEWIPWEYVSERDKFRGEPDWEPSKPFSMYFTTGATVYCKGIKDPDSARGPNINWLWYDEGARDKSGKAWHVAIASVRVGEDPQAWVTTTPRGIRHWLNTEFVKKELPTIVIELLEELGWEGELYDWFHLTIHDNKQNLDPLYYASMLATYVGWWKEQEIEGLFVEAGGVLADREWFEIVDVAPVAGKRARFWDFAATAKKLAGEDPDYTVGLRLTKSDQGIYFIEHIVRSRSAPGDVERLIEQTAHLDSRDVAIGLEQEPGASGKLFVASMVRALDGFNVTGFPVSGDKVSRAMPWLSQAQYGNVKIVNGPWASEFLDEVEGFPDGSHDDQVDAMSGAHGMLAGIAAGTQSMGSEEMKAASRWTSGTTKGPRWKRTPRRRW